MATDLAERRFSTGLRWNEVMNFSLWIEVSFSPISQSQRCRKAGQAAEMCMLEENWHITIPRRFARSQLTIALSFDRREKSLRYADCDVGSMTATDRKDL